MTDTRDELIASMEDYEANRSRLDALYEAREKIYRDAWKPFYLTTRTFNVLRNTDCLTVEDVRKIGFAGFKRFPNCGKMTIAEIGKAIGGWYEPQPPPEVTPEMVLAGLEVWDAIEDPDVLNWAKIMPAIYRAMRLARPLSDGPGA